MIVGLLIGAGMFAVVAILGERNALYIPAVVLLCAAAANVLAGPSLLS